MPAFRLAIIQRPPAYLDLDQSLQRLEDYVSEAAFRGAQLAVFGESWLCGYPSWLDHCPGIALWDHPPTKAAYARMHANAVEVPGPISALLGDFSRTHQMFLVIGVNECVSAGPGGGTLYNSLLTFGPDGRLLNHHRKLMPTYTEKLLYGLGDGHGLRTVETPFGRLGGLICWEHWMPLTRQCLHDQNEWLHVAVWPAVNEAHLLASRHYALEGRCYVIAAGQILNARDLPENLELKPELKTEASGLLLNGGSCVIGPDGNFLLPPQYDEEATFTVDIPDTAAVLQERLTLDVSGHYFRPDIFSYDVKRTRQR